MSAVERMKNALRKIPFPSGFWDLLDSVFDRWNGDFGIESALCQNETALGERSQIQLIYVAEITNSL